jgi:hypothetical protein
MVVPIYLWYIPMVHICLQIKCDFRFSQAIRHFLEEGIKNASRTFINRTRVNDEESMNLRIQAHHHLTFACRKRKGVGFDLNYNTSC